MSRILLCSWWPFRGWWAIRRCTHPWDRPLSTGHGVRSVRESGGSERPYRREAFSVDSWGTFIDRRWKTRTAVLHDRVRSWNTGKPEEGLRVSFERPIRISHAFAEPFSSFFVFVLSSISILFDFRRTNSHCRNFFLSNLKLILRFSQLESEILRDALVNDLILF